MDADIMTIIKQKQKDMEDEILSIEVYTGHGIWSYEPRVGVGRTTKLKA